MGGQPEKACITNLVQSYKFRDILQVDKNEQDVVGISLMDETTLNEIVEEYDLPWISFRIICHLSELVSEKLSFLQSIPK